MSEMDIHNIEIPSHYVTKVEPDNDTGGYKVTADLSAIIRRLLEKASIDICMEIMSNEYETEMSNHALNGLVNYVKERLTPDTGKLEVDTHL